MTGKIHGARGGAPEGSVDKLSVLGGGGPVGRAWENGLVDGSVDRVIQIAKREHADALFLGKRNPILPNAVNGENAADGGYEPNLIVDEGAGNDFSKTLKSTLTTSNSSQRGRCSPGCERTSFHFDRHRRHCYP
jgi:hypothetical protein